MAQTYIQDPSARLDYTFDWSAQLAANGTAQISSATVVATGGAVVSNLTVASPTVTFRLATNGVTSVPSIVDVTNHVILDTGEEDERTMRVHVTNR
jgi:phenylalanyl-tRNA synthetase beta subunit